jgi:hypothetical protein
MVLGWLADILLPALRAARSAAESLDGLQAAVSSAGSAEAGLTAGVRQAAEAITTCRSMLASWGDASRTQLLHLCGLSQAAETSAFLAEVNLTLPSLSGAGAGGKAAAALSTTLPLSRAMADLLQLHASAAGRQLMPGDLSTLPADAPALLPACAPADQQMGAVAVGWLSSVAEACGLSAIAPELPPAASRATWAAAGVGLLLPAALCASGGDGGTFADAGGSRNAGTSLTFVLRPSSFAGHPTAFPGTEPFVALTGVVGPAAAATERAAVALLEAACELSPAGAAELPGFLLARQSLLVASAVLTQRWSLAVGSGGHVEAVGRIRCVLRGLHCCLRALWSSCSPDDPAAATVLVAATILAIRSLVAALPDLQALLPPARADSTTVTVVAGVDDSDGAVSFSCGEGAVGDVEGLAAAIDGEAGSETAPGPLVDEAMGLAFELAALEQPEAPWKGVAASAEADVSPATLLLEQLSHCAVSWLTACELGDRSGTSSTAAGRGSGAATGAGAAAAAGQTTSEHAKLHRACIASLQDHCELLLRLRKRG